MAQKITQKNYLPSIYRFITEQPTEMALLLVVTLVGLCLISYNLLQTLHVRDKLHLQRSAITWQVNLWNTILAKYPGYRDGYFHLAVLEYQLGNYQQSRTDTQKSLQLDPQFTYGIVLNTLLDQKMSGKN